MEITMLCCRHDGLGVMSASPRFPPPIYQPIFSKSCCWRRIYISTQAHICVQKRYTRCQQRLCGSALIQGVLCVCMGMVGLRARVYALSTSRRFPPPMGYPFRTEEIHYVNGKGTLLCLRVHPCVCIFMYTSLVIALQTKLERRCVLLLCYVCT